MATGLPLAALSMDGVTLLGVFLCSSSTDLLLDFVVIDARAGAIMLLCNLMVAEA